MENLKIWQCRCGQEAFAPEGLRPYPIHWSDHHSCSFELVGDWTPQREEAAHD